MFFQRFLSVSFIICLFLSVITTFFSKPVKCSQMKAAMDTTYKLFVHEYKNGDPKKAVPEHQIEIEANHLPLSIHFKSRSSKLNLSQSHASNRPEFQKSSSTEEPDVLLHESRKKIIQQIKEVIEPHQKIVTEIRPTQEELKQVFFTSKENFSDEEGKSEHKEDEQPEHQQHQQHSHHQEKHQQSSPEVSQYLQSSSSSTPFAGQTPPQPTSEIDNEAIYSAMMEDAYSDDDGAMNNSNEHHLQQDEPNMELQSENEAYDSSNDVDDEIGNMMEMSRSKSTPVPDHLPQPSQEHRLSVQLPSSKKEMRQLQLLAARYMYAQYIKQYLRQQQQQNRHQHRPLTYDKSETIAIPSTKYVVKRKQIWPSTIKRAGGGGKSFDLLRTPKKAFSLKKKYNQKGSRPVNKHKPSKKRINKREKQNFGSSKTKRNDKYKQISRRSGPTLSPPTKEIVAL